VVIQSVRGTFGSGGVFEPMRNERADGLATLEWITRQPWFGGSIVLAGASYLGFAQWALGGELPPEVKAMIPNNTESGFTLEFLRPDGLSLETPFGWGVLVDGQERRGALLRMITLEKKVARALRTLPLGDADVAAVGHRVDYIQDILARSGDDPYWAPLDRRDAVAERPARTCSPTRRRRCRRTPRLSGRSAPRSGSPPASRALMSSSASATSTPVAARGTSATA
jgi:uncharacterized protein